jgi:hypothetical protein
LLRLGFVVAEFGDILLEVGERDLTRRRKWKWVKSKVASKAAAPPSTREFPIWYLRHYHPH